MHASVCVFVFFLCTYFLPEVNDDKVPEKKKNAARVCHHFDEGLTVGTY